MAASTLTGSNPGQREKSDSSEQAGGDFSSLLASLWFAPPMLQPAPSPAASGQETTASPETIAAASLEQPSSPAGSPPVHLTAPAAETAGNPDLLRDAAGEPTYDQIAGANFIAEQPASMTAMPMEALAGSPSTSEKPNPILQTPALEPVEATMTPAPPPTFVEQPGASMPIHAPTEAHEQINTSQKARPTAGPAPTIEPPNGTPRPIPVAAGGYDEVVIPDQVASPRETNAGVPVDPPDPSTTTRTVNGHTHHRVFMSEPPALTGRSVLPVDSSAEPQPAPDPTLPTPSLLQRVVNPEATVRPMTVASKRQSPASPSPLSISESFSASEPQILVDHNAPAPTLREQAAQRDANLVAGLLAEAKRGSSETNPMLAIKRQFLNEFGLRANGSTNESGSHAGGNALQGIQTGLSFAQVANEPAPIVATGSTPAAQVVSHILALAETLNGRPVRSIRLRLQPEELGQVEIQLKRDAQGSISAHLTAEHESSRRALSQSLGQLRETLERAGLTVDRLEVNSEAASLTGNSANQNPHPRNQKSQSPITRLPTNTETEDRKTRGAGDHKLLSLSA